MFEAVGSVKRVIAAYHRLKQSNIFVFLASGDMKLESGERNKLMPQLLGAIDQVFHVMERGRMMLKRC